MARVLDTAALRTRDLCARLGGKEFALLLREADEEAARQLGERCRKLLLREAIPHRKSQLADVVAASMGVGAIVAGARDSAAACIAQVDRRLYQAKPGGRNGIPHR